MASGRKGMTHLNGHIMCAVDVETTGTEAGIHDMIQICVLPLDYNLDPWKEKTPFYTDLKCKRPENIDPEVLIKSKQRIANAELRGLDPWRAADLFDEWFQKLGLVPGKRIVPLAHNWPFDRSFILDWLGSETFDQLFDARFRDTMVVSSFCNDRADFMIEPYPYAKVDLTYLASSLEIPHERAHDAMGDCITTVEVYKRLIKKYL